MIPNLKLKEILIGKMKAERMLNLSSAEVFRVFKDCVAANKCICAAIFFIGFGMITETDIKGAFNANT